jgi:hypothetical protein
MTWRRSRSVTSASCGATPNTVTGGSARDNALYFWREVLELGEVREVLT